MARPCFAKLALPVLVAGCLAGSAKADLVTLFTGTSPSQQVVVSANSGGKSRSFESPVGPFNFIVISDDTGSGLGSPFRSFCADFFQDVSVPNAAQGTTGIYSYQLRDFAALPDVNGNPTKVAKIQALYDRYYDLATDAEKGAAFQLALWEILYDPNANDLSGGNFTARRPNGSPEAPSSIGVAQSWLNSLGDGTIPANKYTLTGLYSPTAQDQIVPSTVPAPAGVVLLVIGAAGLIARRKFAKKKGDVEPSEATSDETTEKVTA